MGCCKSDCMKWMTSTNFFVYFSHFLSSWGDRMWSFGVGLFLINISPMSLQLTAVYGLSAGLSILLFGALIGDIVDRMPRLTAAQRALVLQNTVVVINAVVIYLYLEYRLDILSLGDWTRHTCYAVIITLAVLSRLFSQARKLAVEKDWIVEICGRDSDALATMTASLRRIDLSTQIVAPIATGAIMTIAGVSIGALFIGGWNLGSVFVEYYFLQKVYNTVPALRRRKGLTKAQLAELKQTDEATEAQIPMSKDTDSVDPGTGVGGALMKEDRKETEDQEPVAETEIDLTDKEVVKDKAQTENSQKQEVIKEQKCGNCPRIFNSIERLYKGWPIYAKYDVALAGLALASLYMTVLGFDSITVGYAKIQGIAEWLIGLLMGASALVGILGTFMYPVMKRHLGLPRTGIFGLSAEVSVLTLCVLSVFMPGSPFDMSADVPQSSVDASVNCTEDNTPLVSLGESIVYSLNATYRQNLTMDVLTNTSATKCSDLNDEPTSPLSSWLLLIGIVLARFGLWVADLSITQLFLERVKEQERGKVNGVQGSLNQFMDMLKFIMVVLAPHPHQFGLLVIISFSFICIGWVLYACFLRKERGHFFHFGPFAKLFCTNKPQALTNTPNSNNEVEV